MSKNKKDTSSHVNIWKHRIKGFLQKNTTSFDPTSPPTPSMSSVYTKSKPSSLIYRMFSTRNKSKAVIQLKKHQWDGDLTSEDATGELPLRTNIMSFFSSPTSRNISENWDDMSRLYMATLQKLRLLSHYSMEHQLVVYHILNQVQDSTASLQQHVTSRNNRSSIQRDFTSMLPGHSMLMGNRNPRRTRYIFMLLSTPASHVAHRVHPVTDAIHKLRKSYAETALVMYPNEDDEDDDDEEKEEEINVMYRFVPAADYLLDPATLRANFYQQQQQRVEYRLGTKFNGNTTTTSSSSEQQQQSHQPKELMAAM